MRNGKSYLGYVVFDEDLRSGKSSVEQSRSCDVSEVPYETRAKEVDQMQDIRLFPSNEDRL